MFSLLLREQWPLATGLIRSQRFNPDRFFSFVKHHSVAKHLVNHLLAHERIGILPGPLVEELRRCHAVRSANGERLIGELLTLHRHLEDAGVEALFFKGPLLSHNYYGNDNNRRFWDLDLLLKSRRQLPQCHKLLFRLGFERRSKTPFGDRIAARFAHAYDYVRPDQPFPTILDLHWSLSTHYSFRIDSTRLWSTVRSCDLRGRQMRTLSAEYELVQLVLAVLRDTERGRLRVKLLVDLFMVLRSVDETMDWQTFFAIRHAEGIARISTEVLTLTLDLLACRDDFPRLATTLEALPKSFKGSADHGLELIEGSKAVLRNKLWAFRLYRGGTVPALLWWACSVPVKMAVFRQ